jgi:tRNA U34 5-methylaminomethyl-2-thiouridine-forming methyltransferase MnmC
MTKSQISHIPTADGSSTLFSTKYGAHYHSLHGAITESSHIFIEAGLKSINLNEINILEVGFGTGLNAALTAQAAAILGIKVTYHTLELHPLTSDEYIQLNYQSSLKTETGCIWLNLCNALWDNMIRISENFLIKKINADFTVWNPELEYNLIYFDAFAPDDQPEMWEYSQFEKLYNSMSIGGKLVTYCVKGDVKRALIQAGFSLERLDGPLGKKHMLRATKQQTQGEKDKQL